MGWLSDARTHCRKGGATRRGRQEGGHAKGESARQDQQDERTKEIGPDGKKRSDQWLRHSTNNFCLPRDLGKGGRIGVSNERQITLESERMIRLENLENYTKEPMTTMGMTRGDVCGALRDKVTRLENNRRMSYSLGETTLLCTAAITRQIGESPACIRDFEMKWDHFRFSVSRKLLSSTAWVVTIG